MWGDIAIAFLLAFITTFVVTPHTMRLAKKVGAIDIPNDRRVNKKPMPRLGGLAVISGFVVSIIYLFITTSLEGKLNLFGEENYFVKMLGFFFGALVLGVVCYIDDVKGVPSFVKLTAQIIASIIVVACGIKIENISIPFTEGKIIMGDIFSYILTVCWIVGITNAINLIDGLDGLSSGVTLISCLSLLMVFALNGSPLIAIVLITALAGALVGFLPFNFSPAKTFIGDTGSNFMGFALAIISILGVAKTYTALVLIAPIIILAMPIFDTLFAIFRRLIKGKSIKAVFKPDKGHLHHKLMAKGYTQKQAVLIMYGITAILGMFAVIMYGITAILGMFAVILLESGIWKALSFAILIIAIVAIGYKDVTKLMSDDTVKKEDNIDEKHIRKQD